MERCENYDNIKILHREIEKRGCNKKYYCIPYSHMKLIYDHIYLKTQIGIENLMDKGEIQKIQATDTERAEGQDDE